MSHQGISKRVGSHLAENQGDSLRGIFPPFSPRDTSQPGWDPSSHGGRPALWDALGGETRGPPQHLLYSLEGSDPPALRFRYVIWELPTDPRPTGSFGVRDPLPGWLRPARHGPAPDSHGHPRLHQPPLPAPRHAVWWPEARPTQGAHSPDFFQWPAASSSCTLACSLEASPGTTATGEGQADLCCGSAFPTWWLTTPKSPATVGPPKAPSPASSGRLCAGHLPSAEPKPPPVAACPAIWQARLSSCGP